MISEKEVQHIARLARIKLSDKEIQEMQEELAKILDYVEQLNELDIENLPPITHSVFLKNIFREDKPEPFKEFKNLIKSAPESEKGFIKTKPVLK